MTQKWLFGAEVNRIQDTLFRASLQRQVVGGSYLLKQFGAYAANIATSNDFDPDAEVLVHAGGNFRIAFTDRSSAEQFGDMLCTAYGQLLDGVMTVAQPISFDAEDGSFAEANETLSEKLGQLKRQRTAPVADDHLPTTAYCESSGVGLATQTKQIDPSDANERYISTTAWYKRQVGGESKGADNQFLDDVRQQLAPPFRSWPFIYSAEDAAHYDSRNNVAYLIADGNNMGRLFSKCRTGQELSNLSNTLQQVVCQAVAKATDKLIGAIYIEGEEQEIPILPLILAGDDVFILLPAPYALDFARQFNLAFEALMQKASVVQAICEREDLPWPTMASAVVFCKRNYPYLLVHKRGKQLEKATKRMIKSVGAVSGEWYSAVSFTAIIGSEMINDSQESGEIRPRLITYWTSGEEQPLSDIAHEAALDIEAVFDQRQCLGAPDARQIPQKRLVELRSLYDVDHLPKKTVQLHDNWVPQFERIMKRIDATDDSGIQRGLIDGALGALGDPNSAYPGNWKWVERAGESYNAHGWLDLLSVWHYAEPFPNEQGAN